MFVNIFAVTVLKNQLNKLIISSSHTFLSAGEPPLMQFLKESSHHPLFPIWVSTMCLFTNYVSSTANESILS